MKTRFPRPAPAFIAAAALALTASILLPSSLRAQSAPPSDPIDAFINSEMAKRKIPGLALAVVREGSPPLIRVYGTANLETGTPVSRSSVFELASITKPLTSAAVMRLVEGGRVALDDPIARFVEDAPAAWSEITVRRLLTHTSGLEELGIPDHQGFALLDVGKRLQLDFLKSRPLLFPPGEKASYSDPGYFLLGLVIEKASGLPYARFMEERIFRPLGMARTGVFSQSLILEGRVAPYSMDEGRLVRGRRDWNHELPSFFGVWSTIEDMARWAEAMDAGSFLSEASWRETTTPARLSDGSTALVMGQPYGLGWELGDYRGRRVQGHGGFSGTYILRFPDSGLTVVVLSNLDNASGSAPLMVAREVAGIVDPALKPVHRLDPAADPDPALTGRLAEMLQAWGEPAALALLTPAHSRFFQAQPEDMRRGMAAMMKGLRALTYLGSDEVRGRGLERMGEPVDRIVYYRAEGPRGFRWITLWLTESGRISYMVNYPH